MAWKAIMVATAAMAIVVAAAAAQAAVEEEINGWNLETTNHKMPAFVEKENYVTYSSVKQQTNGVESNSLKPNKVSIRMKLLAGCSEEVCEPGYSTCPDGCHDCPEDIYEEVVWCRDKVQWGPKTK